MYRVGEDLNKLGNKRWRTVVKDRMYLKTSLKKLEQGSKYDDLFQGLFISYQYRYIPTRYKLLIITFK